MNGPKKLERYITLCWKGLRGTNTSLLYPILSYEENEGFFICVQNSKLVCLIYDNIFALV